jgi:GntR family transcriptional regulator
MINLNPTDSRPIYEQICEKMRELIIGGYLKENDKIPSVRDMAASLAINPNTIQKAYKTLEVEGYIYSKPAKGYFVGITNKSEQRLPLLIKEFSECVGELKFLGYEKEELLKIIDEIYEKGSAKND